jgi:hypothetical protein
MLVFLAEGAAAMTRSLVGTWRLASLERRDLNGMVFSSETQDDSGYLTYTADGYVSATITGRRRAAFASQDRRRGTAEEKVAAFDTYVSYCGTYEVHDDTVTHHVLASLFPNWAGQDLKRTITWDGENLRLSTPPTVLDGKTQTVSILWERLSKL